jgi:glycosyltransferase involved in cell wall biosynthesis
MRKGVRSTVGLAFSVVRKRRLIVIGPLPPPIHGVTVSTSLVLANRTLRSVFEVAHVDTSDHRDGRNVGHWDATNVQVGLRNVATLIGALKGRPGTVYLPISQSPGAFLRDSLFICAARLRGWRVAIHLRGSEILQFYESRSRAFQWWARHVFRLVSSAAVMGDSLRDVFGELVAPDKVVVVPNGTPRPSRGRAPASSELTVLFLSNLRRRKGIVEAVEAACIAAARVPHARFVFAGGWEDAQLEAELRRKAAPLGDRIEFLPPVFGAAKDDLLAAAAILLFPPREPEGHPRVVLEAIAAAVPVVTTDQGAIAETVADGISGFVVPTSSPELIAERVTRLLFDNELRERMSRAALATYESRFTQEIADQTLVDWLDSISRASRR